MVSNICYFHPYLGNWSNLTSIFFKWVAQPPTSFFQVFFSQTDHQLGTSLDGPIHFPHGSRKPMSYWSGGPRQLPSLPPPEGLRRKMIQGLTDFFLEDGNGGIYGWCIYSCCILLVGGGLDKFCYFHPLLTWWNSETISFWFPPTTGHLQDDANF